MGFDRIFLYHADYPEGRIFSNEAEYRTALVNGAVEHPCLIATAEPSQGPVNVLVIEKKPWQKAQAARKAKAAARKATLPNPE